MSYRRNQKLSARLGLQKGITLVELMVAGVLALIISYFAMSIMMTSSETASRSNGQAQAQEAGRFILSWLHTESRRAGYNSDITVNSVQPFATPCVAPVVMPPAAGGNCSFNSDTSDSDRLAIQRTFSTTSGNLRDTVDCTGVDLSALGLTTDSTILTDVYWVERNTGGSDGDAYDDVLRCVTYSNDTNTVVAPAQTIASGVEGLQILYAEGASDTDRTIRRYVRASDLTDIRNVTAVRISVLTRSWADNANGSEQRSYVLLDAAPYTFSDGVARQIMTTTVALTNF